LKRRALPETEVAHLLNGESKMKNPMKTKGIKTLKIVS
jgi:hypothetical protein